ncbi:MAG: hypothetical protein ABIK65_15545 [Candidatus Eisenbacteria bacterium]
MTMDRLFARAASALVVGGLFLGAAGCGKKSEDRAAGGTTGDNPPPRAAAGNGMTAAGLGWSAPESWIIEAPESSMRIAQYRLPSGREGVEDGLVTVFHFGPGGGGGIDANIQRWANQFRQEDGSDPMSKAVTARFDSGPLKISTIELSGRYTTSNMMGGGRTYDEPGWRLIGGILEGPGGPWFFKGVGPAEVVQAHRDGFVGLLRSAHPAG